MPVTNGTVTYVRGYQRMSYTPGADVVHILGDGDTDGSLDLMNAVNMAVSVGGCRSEQEYSSHQRFLLSTIRLVSSWGGCAALIDPDYCVDVSRGIPDGEAASRSAAIIGEYCESIVPCGVLRNHELREDWRNALFTWERFATRLALDDIRPSHVCPFITLHNGTAHETWELCVRRPATRHPVAYVPLLASDSRRIRFPDTSAWIGLRSHATSEYVWVSVSGLVAIVDARSNLRWFGHVMACDHPVVMMLLNYQTNIIAMCRNAADASHGYDPFGTYPRTATERRAGMSRTHARFVFGYLDTARWNRIVRCATRVIPRDWNQRDIASQSESRGNSGLHSRYSRQIPNLQATRTARRGSLSQWNWSTIPEHVASIMEHDLTMHLDEPQEAES